MVRHDIAFEPRAGGDATATPSVPGLVQLEARPPEIAGLRPCELRRSRAAGEGIELICGAGGFALGVAGRDDAAIVAACAACPIPDALGNRWACLHLRPIRVERDGQWESFFSCRWFYTLNLRRQPRSLVEMCVGCIYWFPRPQVALMGGYWEETEKIRTAVADAMARPDARPDPQHSLWARTPPEQPSIWRWIRRHLLGWV
jgi:hypothetical protein